VKYASGLILELNRMLLTLRSYGMPDGLSVVGLEAMLKSTTYGGRIPDHALTISLAADAGMIQQVGGCCRLTSRGRAFADLNPERSYELSHGQARFLAEAVIFDGPYRGAAVRLFRRFRRDSSQRTFVLPLAAMPRDDSDATSLLSTMSDCGVLESRSGSLFVTREFLPDVSRICAPRPISQAELEWLIDVRGAQGDAAEHWVLQFEMDRLKANECPLEAAAILRVSELDVAAGYDIASFDGTSEALNFDRFIEVKSTSRADPDFFWSVNEFETARDLRGRYWIYLLLRFGFADQNLLAVQDPVGEVESGRIVLHGASYRATIQTEASHAW
jgi:hypothetical protein